MDGRQETGDGREVRSMKYEVRKLKGLDVGCWMFVVGCPMSDV